MATSSSSIDHYVEILSQESRWYTLGVFLGVPNEELKSIEQSFYASEGVTRCYSEICCRLEQANSLSWENIVTALKRMKRHDLVDQIHPPQLPVACSTSGKVDNSSSQKPDDSSANKGSGSEVRHLQTDQPSAPSKQLLYLPLKSTEGISVTGRRKPRLRLPTSHQSQLPPAARVTNQGRFSVEQKPEKELQVEAVMGKLVFSSSQSYVIDENMNDMTETSRIGSGTSMFKMLHKPSGRRIAAKRITWQHETTQELKHVLMGLEVMKSHDCPFVVEYYGSAMINIDFWMFTELMETCLDALMNNILKGPIPEPILCKMCVPILKALDYFWTGHKVIHKDVRSSNVLIDRAGNVKVCDFNIGGRYVGGGRSCAPYLAPERITVSKSYEYDFRVDVWSLGISLVELANGISPYAREKFPTDFQLLTHILQAPPPSLDKNKFSENFCDFVAQCLAKNFEDRPTYSWLLTHPLTTEYESKPIDLGKWMGEVY